jgi:ADP-ribosyl-[dinitrogen reductase] hydrolase
LIVHDEVRIVRQPDVHDRLRGMLWGMFVGDALAMPAHWYYDVAALQRDFGTIRDYQEPPDHHPNSFLSQASTGASGRGSQSGDVVGDIILHGKKHLWSHPRRHYHFGLRAGDNTLNLLCARVLLRGMIAAGRYDSDGFLRAYIAFMTTPDSHNDTYAESYHRDFFANYARGVAPDQCAGAEGHDTASIGGLVSLPPVIATAVRERDPATVERSLLAHLRLTHRSAKLERHALALGSLLTQLLQDPAAHVGPLAASLAESFGFPASQVVERVDRERRPDVDVIGSLLSPACYIDQSFPAVLYLAARYPDDFEAALVANTNVGGDNCHRGTVLGAILGAALGVQAIPQRWIQGLTSRAELEEELESFVVRFG